MSILIFIWIVNGEFALIQNVKDSPDALSRVFNVGQTWLQSLVNLGFNAEPLPEMPPHVIFQISQNGQLLDSVNNTQNATSYVSVLDYGRLGATATDESPAQNRYAAILPLAF